ncbi:unnamed protein product [Protopolystoma xenopodis]|uniref:Uncharacterized protein n=1 Tax=Protopolystoma xenopodis TaxID=117903 RepID=A0A3S5B4I8_9PLAT|nr:unnamed protein product [Protopolystoma xenopodis]
MTHLLSFTSEPSKPSDWTESKLDVHMFTGLSVITNGPRSTAHFAKASSSLLFALPSPLPSPRQPPLSIAPLGVSLNYLSCPAWAGVAGSFGRQKTLSSSPTLKPIQRINYPKTPTLHIASPLPVLLAVMLLG